MTRTPAPRSASFTVSTDEAVKEAFQELGISLHELQVSQEELRQQNEVLVEQRRRHQELFDFAPDAYVIMDATGTIREANRGAAKLLCASPHHLLGKPLAVYVEPNQRSFP